MNSFTIVSDDTDPKREHLLYTTPEGKIICSVVKNGTLSTVKLNINLSVGVISSAACKGDLIVLGDTNGLIYVWNIMLKQARKIPTQMGRVRKIVFNRAPMSYVALVVFADGSFGVWEMSTAQTMYTR